MRLGATKDRTAEFVMFKKLHIVNYVRFYSYVNLFCKIFQLLGFIRCLTFLVPPLDDPSCRMSAVQLTQSNPVTLLFIITVGFLTTLSSLFVPNENFPFISASCISALGYISKK